MTKKTTPPVSATGNSTQNVAHISATPSTMKGKPALFDYAFVASYVQGTPFVQGMKPTFGNTLMALKDMAMAEQWEYSRTPNPRPLPILYNYLIHTFARVKEEGKIMEVGNHSSFNTGLVTKNQEEIFMLFKKNTVKGGWTFIGFHKD